MTYPTVKRPWIPGTIASLSVLLLAAVQPATSQPVSDAHVREGLARATRFMQSIATEGGYLWWYSVDLQERWGEGKATPTQIWIQPPGTPSMGMAFLRAFQATGDTNHFRAAHTAASALARGQLESGGWDYLIDFDPQRSRQWYRRSDRGQLAATEAAQRRNSTTYDDDNTQSALRFLLAFVDAAKKVPGAQFEEIQEALDYGLGKLLEAQYPNGAWPQRFDGKPRDPAQFPIQPARIPDDYPRVHPKQSYAQHYTFNDDTQRDCIRTLLEAWRRTEKEEYLAAAKRGGNFILLAQLPAPQSAWAQQYNADMEPAWARAFEPPSVCTSESVGVIRTLIELYLETGEKKYLVPIPAAIAWFKASELKPNLWARFYELGTNRPIYGDRDGKIYYHLADISEERRKGYSWIGSYGIPEVIALFERIQKDGRDAHLARQTRTLSPAQQEARRKQLAPRVAAILGDLDDQGRWITGGRIETRRYIQNAGVLCEYLESQN
jgi:PelA/Pel-15E family pectate lyase